MQSYLQVFAYDIYHILRHDVSASPDNVMYLSTDMRVKSAPGQHSEESDQPKYGFLLTNRSEAFWNTGLLRDLAARAIYSQPI